MNSTWVEKQWNGVQLGDKRLEKRAIKIAEHCLRIPDVTIPKKFGNWSDLKGAYRFFSSDKVTHDALQQVHYKNVFEIAANSKNLVLFIQDGSELIYNKHPCTNGLGPTADAFGQGIMFHTCLAVECFPDWSHEILGLAKQTPWIRPEYKGKKAKKTQEEKESLVWLNTLKAIGRPPDNSKWVSVGDRANDIYEYISGAIDEDWDFVLRTKHDRTILVNGEEKHLKEWVRSLESVVEYTLDLRSRNGSLSRQANLKIAYGKATILPPKGKSGKMIPVTYVRAYDPEDEGLEWILVTSLEVNSAEDALQIIKIYEKRWIIEEYHKCLKTGCRMEDAQLKNGNRLLALFGILVSVQGVRKASVHLVI